MDGGLILDQRVSNEQNNVYPTKYVAVGPTLKGHCIEFGVV